MTKHFSFSLFIVLCICLTARAQEELAQIFGGQMIQPWDPLSHKVVFVRSILEESKADGNEVSGIKQIRNNCTGVLVRPQLILTAAHCYRPDALRHEIIFSIHPDQMTASDRALLDTPEENRIRAEVVDQILISKLMPAGQNVDLALLKIASPAPFPYLPIAMTASNDVTPVPRAVRLIGYGRSENSSNSPRLLRSVEVVTEPFGRDHLEIVIDQHNGKGICSGDSGGPVFVYVRGEFMIIGINSYVFSYNTDPVPDDTCLAFGAAVHLGPFRSLIQKGIDLLEKGLR